MTNNSQYQHLIKLINETSAKVENYYKNLEGINSKLSLLSVTEPTKTVTFVKKCILGPKSTVLELDVENIDNNLIFVTLVGGGGAGGAGYDDSEDLCSGGGGGAGETIYQRIMSLENSTGKIIITAGSGGSETSANGEDSSVEVETSEARRIITVSGGYGGTKIQGGKGAVSKQRDIYDGNCGKPGQVQNKADSTKPPIQGGNGGSSYFAEGGNGGYTYFTKDVVGRSAANPKGQDGSFGSGGGGSVPGISSVLVGKGGAGMVIIEYNLIKK